MYWTTSLSLVLLSQVKAFAPSSFLVSKQQQRPYISTNPNASFSHHKNTLKTSCLYSSSELEGTCLLTPEGYGFSSTMERVLTKAKRGSGFYTATKDARVIDVMGGITEGQLDAALVYDQNELLGIFTESDYIKVSLCVYICVYIYVCVYICIYMCVYICIYVCIHSFHYIYSNMYILKCIFQHV
jgi:hypothetical protein